MRVCTYAGKVCLILGFVTVHNIRLVYVNSGKGLHDIFFFDSFMYIFIYMYMFSKLEEFR